jgi:hypothetical protein
LALALCAACSHPEPDATPEGALKLWLEQMEDSQDDTSVARQAYALLGPAARANLEARARRASQAQGRRTEAIDMLAAGRFGLRFRPKSMRSTVVGDQATVEVLGADPASEHAIVKCVREGGGWRVEPELPEAPLAPKRGSGG